MPAARRAGCGAALWLWLVSSVLCRGWTAPSASHDDTSNKPQKRKFLEAFYKDSPTHSRNIKDHIVIDGEQVLNGKRNEGAYDETSSVSPDSLHSGQQSLVRTCLEAVVIDLTAEEDAPVGDVSVIGETAPQTERGTSELEMTLERKCTPFSQTLGVQWINSNNLCWLDCILSALVHSEVVKETVMIDLCSKEESVFWHLFMKYNQASTLYTSQLDRVKAGYCKKLTSEIFAKIETCLNEVRDKIFIRLQPQLRCTLGDMESPVFAFPLLLKIEPCIKKLFTYSFFWNFECSRCGYKYQNRCMKNLVTFTNVMPNWHPLNAAHFGPCNKCNSTSQIRKMVLEKVSPIFMLHFVEGLPHNNLQQYSFLFKGCLYQITSIIQYRAHNHFITWILNDDGSWLECDDLKGPCCERHEKFRVPASEIHIVIWEGKTSRMTDKTSACIPLQNTNDQQTFSDEERVSPALRSVGDRSCATMTSGAPHTHRAAAPNILTQDESAAHRHRVLSGLKDLIGRNILPLKRKRTQVNSKGFLLENTPVAKPGVVKTNTLQSQESLMAPLVSALGKEKLTQDQFVDLNFPSHIVQLNTENTTIIKPVIDPIQGVKSIEIEDMVTLEEDAPLKQFLSPKTKKLKLEEDVTPRVSNWKKKETATFAQTKTAKSLQNPSLKETQKKPFVRSLFEDMQSKGFPFMPPGVSPHNKIVITDLQPSVKGTNNFGGVKTKRKNQEDNWASKKARFCASKPPAASAPRPSHPPSASTASVHTEARADQESGKKCEDAL